MFQIIPPHATNARNVNARNANTAPPAPDQEESNAKFINVIQILTQSMTNNKNWVRAHVN